MAHLQNSDIRVSFLRLAAVIPSLAYVIAQKSVGICICYRPTFRGFSHCLSLLDGNAEAHAYICNQSIRLYFSRNIVPKAR